MQTIWIGNGNIEFHIPKTNDITRDASLPSAERHDEAEKAYFRAVTNGMSSKARIDTVEYAGTKYRVCSIA